MEITSTKPSVDFSQSVVVSSMQTASVLATAGWSDSGNGFSVTIPETGRYKLSVEFNAYAAASSDGYWCIGINGVNNTDTIRRTVGGAGGTALSPAHIEVITDCISGDVITLRNDEASGDVRADIGSSSNALGYIKAELINKIVPVFQGSGWATYPLTITGSIANPTNGTIQCNKAYYRIINNYCEIMFNYRQSTAGTHGTGLYYFSKPVGLTINTAMLDATPSQVGNIIGIASGYGSGSGSASGVVILDAANNIQLVLNGIPVQASGSYWGLGIADTSYSFKAMIPIV